MLSSNVMLRRQTTGSVVCPSCGRLVGVLDAKCFNCGHPVPGLWGYGPAINRLTQNANVFDVVLGGCVLMFVVSLALRPSAAFEGGGFLSLLSPGGLELFLLGSSGAAPIFGEGRWWTVLSAAWLHGSLLHIAFNMYWLRGMGPQVAQVLGPGRTFIVYTAGSVVGFLGTSIMFFVQVPFLQGAAVTVGASASLCGLVGGLYAYGQRTGHSGIKSYVMQFVVSMLIIGLVVDIIDNWAHVFGFLGGYVAARLMRPLEDESPFHQLGALLCFVAFFIAIVVSVLHGLPTYRALSAG
ncbi:MAG: rhomboid family intramembrane serine protease [Acidobacteriota bacterium]